MFDLVEWAAQQPWSDGNVGMVGISYFAMTQTEAAVERPPHLKAIMPVDLIDMLLSPSVYRTTRGNLGDSTCSSSNSSDNSSSARFRYNLNNVLLIERSFG